MPARPTPSTPPERSALFVRLPVAQAVKLDQAAQRLGTAKGRLVAELVARHLEPAELPTGIDALRGAPVGGHSFTPAHELEVLTLEQVATLLALDVDATLALVEQGEIPGRRLGAEWRFSRRAILDWLRGD